MRRKDFSEDGGLRIFATKATRTVVASVSSTNCDFRFGFYIRVGDDDHNRSPQLPEVRTFRSNNPHSPY
jgi:hypothetical protein